MIVTQEILVVEYEQESNFLFITQEL